MCTFQTVSFYDRDKTGWTNTEKPKTAEDDNSKQHVFEKGLKNGKVFFNFCCSGDLPFITAKCQRYDFFMDRIFMIILNVSFCGC